MDEAITMQFDTINKKLDKLTELTEQTHLQEYRITKLEEAQNRMAVDIKDIKAEVTAVKHRPGETALKWGATIIGGIVSVLIGFIAVKVGLK